MKTRLTLFLLLLPSLSLMGQSVHKVSFIYGLETFFGIGGVDLPSDVDVSSSLKPSFGAGVFMQIPCSEVLCLQPQLAYRKAQIHVSGNTNNTNFSLSEHYLEIPIRIQYYPLRRFNVAPIVFVEPFVGYLVEARANGELYDYRDKGLPDATAVGFKDGKIDKEFLNEIEYGISAGMGAGWKRFKAVLKYSRNLNIVGREGVYNLYQVRDGKYQCVTLSVEILI